jgi:hypothetical protein
MKSNRIDTISMIELLSPPEDPPLSGLLGGGGTSPPPPSQYATPLANKTQRRRIKIIEVTRPNEFSLDSMGNLLVEGFFNFSRLNYCKRSAKK